MFCELAHCHKIVVNCRKMFCESGPIGGATLKPALCGRGRLFRVMCNPIWQMTLRSSEMGSYEELFTLFYPCVVFLCSEDIEISWRVPRGVSVNRRKIDLDSSRLTLTDLRLSDAGQYVCVGNNALGRTEFKFQLLIHGTSSPTADFS